MGILAAVNIVPHDFFENLLGLLLMPIYFGALLSALGIALKRMRHHEGAGYWLLRDDARPVIATLAASLFFFFAVLSRYIDPEGIEQFSFLAPLAKKNLLVFVSTIFFYSLLILGALFILLFPLRNRDPLE